MTDRKYSKDVEPKAMDKNEERNTNQDKKTYNKTENIKRHLLILAVIGILLSLFGFVLIYIGKNIIDIDEQQIDIPKDYEKSEEFLINNSNYFDIVKECEYKDCWPSEYFEINIKAKKISYYRDSLVAEIEYINTDNNSIKNFKNQESKQSFEYFPPMENLADLIENEYLEVINVSDLDDDTKYLCILYNALAGHPSSYIILGLDKDEWKYYTPDDFPKYILDKDKLLNSIKGNSTNDSQLNTFIENAVSERPVKAISFDYRGDKIWYGEQYEGTNGKAQKDSLKAPYEYTKLTEESACGWVVPDNDKEKMMFRAKEYYKPDPDGKTIFISNITYNNLKELKWNERDKRVNQRGYTKTGISLLVIGLSVLLYLLIKYKRIKTKDTRPNTDAPNKSAETEIDDEDSKGSGHAPEKKLSKKQKEELASIIIKEFKGSREFENIIKGAKASAIDEFKESDEFENIIKGAKASAINEFKKNDEYKTLVTNNKKWTELCGITAESKLIAYLCKIQEENKNSFPSIHTLAKIYNDIKNGTKDKQRQISLILNALNKQVGNDTGLLAVYNTLIDDANYANNVRKRFEKCKDIAETYSKHQGYNQIVTRGEALTIWEREAIMLWAMESINDLLSVFDISHFTKEIISMAAEMHKDDIMQIFATRIFKKSIEEPEEGPGMLTTKRSNIVREKLIEIQEKYQISMNETQAYNDFVNSLDSVYDKIKYETAFIMIMKEQFVDEFVHTERKIEDLGQYLSLLVAMGLHMSDYVRFMSGNNIDYCPNMRFALSGLNADNLDNNTEFRHNDPRYSGKYTNRVYEWFEAIGIKRIRALIDNKLIMP